MWNSAGAPPMFFPLLEGESLLSLEMLDVTEKEHVAPAPAPISPIPEEFLRSSALLIQDRLPIWRED